MLNIGMTVNQGQVIRRSISENWVAYLEAVAEDNAVRLNFPVSSERWNPVTRLGQSYVHASALDGCAKKPALEQHIELPERHNISWAQRAAEGTLMGNLFAEAMSWWTGPDTHREVRLKDEKLRLCGQVDVALTTTKWKNIPIECKLTNTWRYKFEERKGLTLGFVLQCVAYMKLLDQNFGYVMTIFDDSAAPVPFLVHMIHRRGSGYEVLDEDGDAMSLDMTEFPSRGDITYISDLEVEDRIAERVRWLDAQIAQEENPYPGPWQWPCGIVRRSKGVLTLEPTCPAFKLCHATTLRVAGFNPNDLPEKIYGSVDPDGYIEMETPNEY